MFDTDRITNVFDAALQQIDDIITGKNVFTFFCSV